MSAEQPSSSTSAQKPAHANPDFWRRIVFMIVYAFASYVVLNVLFLFAVANAIYILITQKRLTDLESVSGNLTRYLAEAMAYVGWASDDKPWPFQSSGSENIGPASKF